MEHVEIEHPVEGWNLVPGDPNARVWWDGHAFTHEAIRSDGGWQIIANESSMTPPMPETTTWEAGWKRDPQARFDYRYWNGIGWTDRVRSHGQQLTAPVHLPPRPTERVLRRAAGASAREPHRRVRVRGCLGGALAALGTAFVVLLGAANGSEELNDPWVFLIYAAVAGVVGYVFSSPGLRGWYRDPTRRAVLRLYDGARWTAWVADADGEVREDPEGSTVPRSGWQMVLRTKKAKAILVVLPFVILIAVAMFQAAVSTDVGYVPAAVVTLVVAIGLSVWLGVLLRRGAGGRCRGASVTP